MSAFVIFFRIKKSIVHIYYQKQAKYKSINNILTLETKISKK